MGKLKLLVPINLAEIDHEVLAATRGAAKAGEISVTLLHVVSAKQQGAACEEARRALLALERRSMSQEIESRVSIRRGDPLVEILAEAEMSQADVVLLSRTAVRDLAATLEMENAGSDTVSV